MPAASFPGSVKTYTDKVDGVSVVQADDINSVQAEVTAIETSLGTNPAASSLPSAGSYNPNGVSTSIKARITNLEAGLTAEATDGTRVGHTLLSTQTLTTSGTTGSVTFSNISGSYRRLIMEIDFSSITTAGAIDITLNNVTSGYRYARLIFSGSPAATDVSTTGTSFPPGTPTGFTGSGTSLYVMEIQGYSRSGSGKVVTVLGPISSLSGYLNTGAVTRIDVSVASSTMSATVRLYGVK